MSDLKPCPFCGGEVRLNEHPPHIFSVRCCVCKASSAKSISKRDVIKAWNTRDNELVINEAIEQVAPIADHYIINGKRVDKAGVEVKREMVNALEGMKK
jgi:Lar family restriction alleviation protein